MRPRRSDSSASSPTKQQSLPPLLAPAIDNNDAPNLEAELEEDSEEMNRTPEENKNPQSHPTKVVLRECSFTPPPALSPAYSLQEDTKEEEEEEMEIEEKPTPKKLEPRPKMKYKKKAEKPKDAIPFLDPNAPKRNRSAYVHFIIHRRSSYSKTVMSQRDINIALAADWQKLTADERIPFQKKAEEEKEKYLELMEEYKKTDSHKEFQKARSKFVTSQSKSSNKNRKRKHGDTSDEDEPVQMAFPKTQVFCPLLQNAAATSSSSLQYSGPIFTPEFMTYNKTRDSYRRQLAVERSNVEHELEALHQYDMDVRIQKQMERVRGVDEKIEETMEKMRTLFGGVTAAKDHLSSLSSLTDWLHSVTRLGQQNHTKKAVKETINKNAKMIIAMRK
uniref:HMG box domain-containing protein n=1 Tax=Caenorhabditis tropicalis TaxID=1561998 RepID=A0A1I7V1F9_9PELO